jgi:hypothetical protein
MRHRLSRIVCHYFEEKVKTDQMITRRRVCAIVLMLSDFTISFIIILTSLLGSNVQAIADIDNKSNVMLHGSSALFTNGSDDADQSFMDMKMMNMMGRGDIAMGFNQNKISHQFLVTPIGVSSNNNIPANYS